MSFHLILLNQSIRTKQIYVTCMDTSSFTVNIKLMMIINSFQMMLKKDLTHQTMKLKDPYQ